MPFLSALLPGIREFRTPFAIGGLWIGWGTAIATKLSITRNSISSELAPYSSLDGLPITIRLSALALATYVLGVVMQGLTHSTTSSKLSKKLRLQIARLGPTPTRIKQLFASSSSVSDRLIQSALRERLSPISETIALLIPPSLIDGEFSLASLRLSKEAPDQFQQYDRLRSESDFRKGICPPIAIIAITAFGFISFRYAAILFVALTIAAVTLGIQGIAQERAADDLLATAIYLGYSSTPVLDSLESTARRRWESHELTRDEAVAWLIDFIAERGLRQQLKEVFERLDAMGSYPDIAARNEMLLGTKQISRQVLTDLGIDVSA